MRSVEFTHRVPDQVREMCVRAERKTSVEVRCPRLVPRGGVVRDRDLYGFFRAPGDGLYDLTFNNGEIAGRIHWVVGGGERGQFERQHLDQSMWVASGRVAELGTRDCGGHAVTGYRFPAHPAGGGLGGHTVALAAAGDDEYWASVHGRDELDASMAMLLETLGAEDPLRLCR